MKESQLEEKGEQGDTGSHRNKVQELELNW